MRPVFAAYVFITLMALAMLLDMKFGVTAPPAFWAVGAVNILIPVAILTLGTDRS